MNMSINLNRHVINKICFFFPYRVISGVPVLFYRLANEIIRTNCEIEIYIIDYADGVMATNVIKHPNIHLITFVDKKFVSPPSDSFLIMQSILPYSIRPELIIPEQSKLIFWTLHPDNLVPNFFPFLSRNSSRNYSLYSIAAKYFCFNLMKKLNIFFSICHENQALWFMDSANLLNTTKHLFNSIESPIFIPVPTQSTDKKISINENIKNNFIRFCWIGRLCDFKIHILKYTLIKLSQIANEIKIKIHFNIVGEGEEKASIESLNLESEFFKLNFIGVLTPNELDQYLLKNVDILTAMGTSALEGAKFGIPTILLDYSYVPINRDYLFRWLFSTENYDLGHEITNEDIKYGNQSLKEIIYDVLNNYIELSNNTYDYFNKNHKLSNIAKLFIEKLSESNLVYSSFPKDIFKKNMFRKIHEFRKGYRQINL